MLLGKSHSFSTAARLIASEAFGPNATSFTSSGISLPKERIVVIGMGPTGSAASTMTCTIDGNAATQRHTSATTQNVCGVFDYDMTAAATGDVVLTFSDTAFRAAIFVFAVRNRTHSASTSDNDLDATGTIDMNAASGDAIVACGYVDDAGFTAFVGGGGLNGASFTDYNPESNHNLGGTVVNSLAGGTPQSFSITESSGAILRVAVGAIYT